MTDAITTAQNFDETGTWKSLLTGPYVPSLVLVCLAVWLHAADSLIVATMLPAIVGDVSGEALVSWSVTLYMIGSILAGAASALLITQRGLRVPIGATAALFAAGCFLSAIAPTMPILLAGRVVQGLGGGGLVAMAFVAVPLLFPRHHMPRALAAISTLWGSSAFLGPLIGGLFVEYATWRWGFVFFGIQAVVLALWVTLYGSRTQDVTGNDTTAVPAADKGKGPLPWPRLGVLCLALLLIAYAGIDVAQIRSIGFIVAGFFGFSVFLWLDAHAGPTRMLPPRSVQPPQPLGRGPADDPVLYDRHGRWHGVRNTLHDRNPRDVCACGRLRTRIVRARLDERRAARQWLARTARRTDDRPRHEPRGARGRGVRDLLSTGTGLDDRSRLGAWGSGLWHGVDADPAASDGRFAAYGNQAHLWCHRDRATGRLRLGRSLCGHRREHGRIRGGDGANRGRRCRSDRVRSVRTTRGRRPTRDGRVRAEHRLKMKYVPAV